MNEATVDKIAQMEIQAARDRDHFIGLQEQFLQYIQESSERIKALEVRVLDLEYKVD